MQADLRSPRFAKPQRGSSVREACCARTSQSDTTPGSTLASARSGKLLTPIRRGRMRDRRDRTDYADCDRLPRLPAAHAIARTSPSAPSFRLAFAVGSRSHGLSASKLAERFSTRPIARSSELPFAALSS